MVRYKHRYMVVELNKAERKALDPLQLKKSSLHYAIISKVQELHGDFGVAAITSGYSSKYCNDKTHIAVIRCRHGPHRLLGSTLPCIKVVDNKRVQVNMLYVGATMKQCFKFIQQYQQKKFDEYCVGVKSEDEKALIRQKMFSLEHVEAMH